MAQIDFTPLEQAGIKQDDFAALMGVSRGAANSWIKGRSGVHALRLPKVVKYLAAISTAVIDKELPLTKGMADDIRLAALRRIILAQLKKG